MLTSKQIEESERLDREIGPRPDCRRESLMPRIRKPRTAQSERSRLERAVIEKAKAYGRANQAVEDHMKKSNEAGSDPRDGWQELRDLESTWEEMLLEAIKPLLEFEANQQQVKK